MDAAAAQARDDGDEQLYSSEEDGGLHDDEARRTPPPAGHLQLEAAVAQLLAAVASAGTNDYFLSTSALSFGAALPERVTRGENRFLLAGDAQSDVEDDALSSLTGKGHSADRHGRTVRVGYMCDRIICARVYKCVRATAGHGCAGRVCMPMAAPSASVQPEL